MDVKEIAKRQLEDLYTNIRIVYSDLKEIKKISLDKIKRNEKWK